MKDLYRILKRYNLLHHMQLLIEKGQFPDKTTWTTLKRTMATRTLEYLEYFTVTSPPLKSGNLAMHLTTYHSLSSLPSCGSFHQHLEQKPVFYVKIHILINFSMLCWGAHVLGI